jgi:Ca2+-binding EF-hand superfamily protein
MTRYIRAAGFAAAALVTVALVGSAALAHSGEMRGMRGGPMAMFDFEAVAGGAEAVDRDTLMEYGVGRLAQFDADGDGRLDRNELAAALPAREAPPLMVFAPARGERMLDRMFERFGAEGEDSIAIEALVRRQVDAIFARFDSDGDGTITRAEAEQPMRSGRWMRRPSSD